MNSADVIMHGQKGVDVDARKRNGANEMERRQGEKRQEEEHGTAERMGGRSSRELATSLRPIDGDDGYY